MVDRLCAALAAPVIAILFVLVLVVFMTGCTSADPETSSQSVDATQGADTAMSDPGPQDSNAEDASSKADPSDVAGDPTAEQDGGASDRVEAEGDQAAAGTDAEVEVEVRPAAPNGRVAPFIASDAAALAGQVEAGERGLLDPTSTTTERADWGHLHQVAIRKMGYAPEWDVEFFEALAPEFRDRTQLHISARRALVNLSSGYAAADFIPAWLIVEPEPAAALLNHYQEAEAATGIEWEFLAAINLIETGMGRIRGLSSAGAQGPMQFLPTTWAESGIGEGDINDPHDAIQGAARYLVRRGGPADMAGAIWGYNNSDDYVTAVQSYAQLLRSDPAAFEAIYNWEIYFHTEAGDVWLPAGFSTPESLELADYLAANPWSEPDPGLR